MARLSEFFGAGSLRNRLSLVLALALLPALVLAVVDGFRTFENTTVLAERNQIAGALVSAREEQRVFIEARRTLETVALMPGIMDGANPLCRSTLTNIQKSSERYGLLAVIRRDGVPVCASPELAPGTTYSDSPYLKAMNANPGFMVTKQIIARQTGQRVIGLLSPIFDANGGHVGHVSLTLSLDWLEQLMQATSDVAATVVALVNKAGEVFADQDVSDNPSELLPQPAQLAPHMKSTTSFFEETVSPGTRARFALAPLLDDKVYLLIGTSQNRWKVGFAWTLAISILAPVIMYLVALGVAWYAVDQLMLRHIDHLRRVADLIRRGRDGVRANLSSAAPLELEELATTVNHMVDSLEQREAQLEKSLEEQRHLTREVYHRVKNNLQIINSLMNLQVRNARSGDSRDALLFAQQRIQAMSLVHDQLHRGDGIAAVRLNSLIRELTQIVQSAVGEKAIETGTEFDLDDVVTDADHAIPLALLLIELLSNAYKHTSLNGTGKVAVTLREMDPHIIQLAVANSVDGTATAETPGIGVRLTGVLARQLRGEIKTTRNGMYRVELVFPGAPPAQP